MPQRPATALRFGIASLACAAGLLVVGAPALAQTSLTTTIPDQGALPDIVPADVPRLDMDRRSRTWRDRIRDIERRCFRTKRPELRERGFAELREITEPAAFQPMLEELSDQDGEVVLVMLDHLAAQGDAGEAALAWAAIFSKDSALRNEASERIEAPLAPMAMGVLDRALRAADNEIVDNAGLLAGRVDATDTIPLLILGQMSRAETERRGDLAWIVFAKNIAYVSDLIPVTGDNSGAFDPVVSTVSEGVVLRVMDAVVISYRTNVHRSLVSMTSRDWGRSTEYLGYDINAWRRWYNEEYVPFKVAQLEKDAERDRIRDLIDR